MIIKGSSRTGPKQLASHLLRADTNERVEILELHSPRTDLAETFRDWQALATGTNGSKGLYHANIDPDARYGMTEDQWKRAVAVLEEELGMQGQPRAVVLHEKQGRQHIHVVWQRTNVDTMTLASDSWNYRAHEQASLRLEQEFGHEHVPGKHAKRDRERQPDPPKADITHTEWQQAERTGLNPAARKDQVTDIFQHSDNGAAFRHALEEEGYVLARGDRRDYVIVDAEAEVHSLARQLKAVKAKDLRDFMADVPAETLPTVEEAKALQREAETRKTDEEKKKTGQQDQTGQLAPPPVPDILTDPERIALEEALRQRRDTELQKFLSYHEAELKQLSHVLGLEIDEKLENFDALQEAERAQLLQEQRQALTGLSGFLDAVQRRLNPQLGAEREAARNAAWEQLYARQKQERKDYLVLQKQNLEDDIEELKERHAQQLRELDARSEDDRDRYLREQELARRLLEDIEERRQREEHQRSRDGPAPPKRSL